jgi:hypothetical protein
MTRCMALNHTATVYKVHMPSAAVSLALTHVEFCLGRITGDNTSDQPTLGCALSNTHPHRQHFGRVAIAIAKLSCRHKGDEPVQVMGMK